MPLYVYEHDSGDCKPCEARFELLEGVNASPLAKCPQCGRPCHRIISPFAPLKSVRDMLSPKNLEKHGFTQYKRAGDGRYEKTCGEGPRHISGD
jgi:putative FmdB family regulatory protein